MSAIREISWAVAADGTTLSPSIPQWGGVQGEDNASELVFRMATGCPLTNPDYQLYIEAVDSAGVVDRTEVLTMTGNCVRHPVPLAWTQNGGTATVRLVAETAGAVVYTLEASIYFENRMRAEQTAKGLFRSEIQQALAEMRELHRQVTVMAAEGGFVPGYADHLKEINAGKAVYIWQGTKAEFEEAKPYLPAGTLAMFTDESSYGLGEALTVSDPDNAKAPGFYAATNITVDGETFSYAFLHVAAYGVGDLHAHQTLYAVGSAGYVLHRNRYNGAWGAWEWDAPPMQRGVEYRTTERWEGKAVYAKHYSADVNELGVLVTTLNGIVGIGANDRLIRYVAYTDTRMIPRSNAGANLAQSLDINRKGEFKFVVGPEFDEKKLYIDCYYYKG